MVTINGNEFPSPYGDLLFLMLSMANNWKGIIWFPSPYGD